MGLVFDTVAFDGRTPDLLCIAEKVAELSGLNVLAKKSEPDVKDDFHDLYAGLTFACAQEEHLRLYSYRPGTVVLNEAPGTQVVHLTSDLGCEPTLMTVTALALEALGGRPNHPISEELRREYGTPITVALLKVRRRKVRKQMRNVMLLGILLLPVAIPVWFLWSLLKMAWPVRKTQKGTFQKMVQQ